MRKVHDGIVTSLYERAAYENLRTYFGLVCKAVGLPTSASLIREAFQRIEEYPEMFNDEYKLHSEVIDPTARTMAREIKTARDFVWYMDAFSLHYYDKERSQPYYALLDYGLEKFKTPYEILSVAKTWIHSHPLPEGWVLDQLIKRIELPDKDPLRQYVDAELEKCSYEWNRGREPHSLSPNLVPLIDRYLEYSEVRSRIIGAPPD